MYRNRFCCDKALVFVEGDQFDPDAQLDDDEDLAADDEADVDVSRSCCSQMEIMLLTSLSLRCNCRRTRRRT